MRTSILHQNSGEKLRLLQLMERESRFQFGSTTRARLEIKVLLSSIKSAIWEVSSQRQLKRHGRTNGFSILMPILPRRMELSLLSLRITQMRLLSTRLMNFLLNLWINSMSFFLMVESMPAEKMSVQLTSEFSPLQVDLSTTSTGRTHLLERSLDQHSRREHISDALLLTEWSSLV